jgi:hypothetical protein
MKALSEAHPKGAFVVFEEESELTDLLRVLYNVVGSL